MTKEEETMMLRIQCYGGILALTDEEAIELLKRHYDKEHNIE
jgi:hypothetical protein